MKTFGESAVNFFKDLKPDFILPEHVRFLLPFENVEAKNISIKFFQKYYNDTQKRILVLGINPGRHGAGITGIAFTDPIRLENECGIKNNFTKRGELSSEFIYHVINKLGGPDFFYRNFFLSAVCPVGFIKEGKNINYYDDKKLLQNSREFIINTLKKQIAFGVLTELVICLGEGKNYKFLKELNEELQIFKRIIPLAHPRFVMQYKRKQLNTYGRKYHKVLTEAILMK